MSRRGCQSVTRGGLLRPAGPFVLAPGLAAPGDIGVADAVALVVADWRVQVADGRVASGTADSLRHNLSPFAPWCEAKGVTRVADVDQDRVLTWCTKALLAPGTKQLAHRTGDAPANGTQRSRVAALSAFSRTMRCLGLDDRDLTADLTLGQPGDAYVRPLTAAEAARCRAMAGSTATDTHGPAVVALALTSASSSETAHVTVGDLRLGDGLVWIHGNRLQTPRWGHLDDTAVVALRDRVG